MQKQVMFFHEDRYSDAIRKINANLQRMDEIKAAYDATGLPALTSDEIRQLILDPTTFLFEKITNGQQVELGGVKLKKDIAIELLQKPAGYDVLLDFVSALRNSPGYDYAVRKAEFVDGGYRLIESADNAQREAYTEYIKNERQQKIYDFVKNVVDKANELWPVGTPGRPRNLTELISGTVKTPVDSEVNQSFQLHLDTLRRYAQVL